MVGRELRREHTKADRQIGEVRLSVQNLSGERFHKVSFEVRKGEILGFAGLVGAGRSETARAIFGADRFSSGKILLEGKEVQFKSPDEAIRNGLAMVPEDRKLLSLFMNLSILFNISVAQLPELSRAGVINNRLVSQVGREFVKLLSIKLNTLNNPVSRFERWQPAEDNPGALAGNQSEAADPRRANPRRGCGRQSRNLPADAQPG